jgi:glyoxylase-like metal-dependent hydrolase (beta-lactamase superfamily II)
MPAIAYNRELDFTYGETHEVTPLVRRIVARNPSAFTLHGTGTYIVGRGRVAVIDPGPDLPEHVEALKRVLAGETVTHILVTHTHMDHSPAAAPLKAATGAPTFGYGPHGSGKLLENEVVEEGGDMAFMPDQRLVDGDRVVGDGWTIEAVHTPGHTSNHLCFGLAEGNLLFTGDHVMGWSTTIVSPPDGDMRAYMASLRRLLDRRETRFVPCHGPVIEDPGTFVRSLIAHRHDRERQILDCVASGLGSIPDMVKRMYADVPVGLHRAAARSVLAHLIHMVEEGRVAADRPPSPAAVYSLP